MAKRIKLKEIIEEGIAGSIPGTLSTIGGMVSRPAFDNMSLSNLVREKYGDVEEDKEINTKEFLESVSNFSGLGKNIYREHNLRNIANQLAKLAETARIHTLRETDDWFDKVSVNRNMKELTNLANSFTKVANESDTLQERLTALYEDMGHILGRYYEIKEDDGTDEGWKRSYRSGDELDDEEEVGEATGDKKEYVAFFKSAMNKFGVSSVDDLSDEDKKKLFNYVDKNWKADKETD